MKNYIFITAIIFILILFVVKSVSAEKSKSQYPRGPQINTQGYYKHGTDQIRFYYHLLGPTNWKNELEIDNIVRDMIRHRNDCHVAHVWYWQMLEEYNPAVMVLVWSNLSTGEYGWSAIKNTPEHWWVSSKKDSWTTQRDFTRNDKMNFQWIINGKRISINIRNPDNVKGWTKHDILYKFSF